MAMENLGMGSASGGGAAGAKGINLTLARVSIDAIIGSYNSICTAITTTFYREFVTEIVPLWQNPNAKIFYDNAEPLVKGMFDSCKITLESVIDTMNSAAAYMASVQGSEFSKRTYDPSIYSFDVSVIQSSDGNGSYVLDESTDQQAKNAISKLITLCDGELKNIKLAVNNSGFVGGQMQQNLIYSINHIATQISSTMDKITNAFNTAITAKTDNVVEATKKIEESFTATETNLQPGMGAAGNVG